MRDLDERVKCKSISVVVGGKLLSVSGLLKSAGPEMASLNALMKKHLATQ